MVIINSNNCYPNLWGTFVGVECLTKTSFKHNKNQDSIFLVLQAKKLRLTETKLKQCILKSSKKNLKNSYNLLSVYCDRHCTKDFSNINS